MKRKGIRKEREKKRSNRVVRNEIIIAPDWVRPLLTSGKVTKTNTERYETFPFFQKHAQTGILKLYLWVVESQIGVNIARGWWLSVQLTGKWIPKFQRDLESTTFSLWFKLRKNYLEDFGLLNFGNFDQITQRIHELITTVLLGQFSIVFQKCLQEQSQVLNKSL